MANSEHLAKIKAGIESWNEWRKKNPTIQVDLRRAKLHMLDLNRINLSDANLSRATMGGTNLRDADLRGAKLYGTFFSEACLDRVNLSKADLISSNLSKANLREATLTAANLSSADLSQANLNGADLIRANLSQADLRHASLDHADLSEASLIGGDLAEASLNQANLSNARLSGANLRGATLVHANLKKANARGTNLSAANLTHANLTSVNLHSASLQYAKMDDTTLTDACLWETQRGRWSIKGIICERAYWDERDERAYDYVPGEFERLYSDTTRIELLYPGGMTTFELNTLPALLYHLTSKYPNSGIRLKSMEETGGGAKISISVEEADPQAVENIRAEADRSQAAQIALRDDQIARLKIQKQLLLEEVFPRMLAAAPQVHITESANVAIAIGSSTVQATQTHNDAKTLLDLLDKINTHRAELELPEPQQANFEQAVQSVQTELGKSEPKRSVVLTGLKVIQDIATKVVESAAEKALTDNWHTWFTQLTVLMHHWSS